MSRNELIDLGELYCEKIRPTSTLADVSEKDNTITTYFCGAYLVHNADKVKEMLGIKEEKKKTEKTEKIA